MNPNVDNTPDKKSDEQDNTSVDTNPNPEVVAPEAPASVDTIPVNDSTTVTQDETSSEPVVAPTTPETPGEQPVVTTPTVPEKKHHKARLIILIVLVAGLLAAAGYYVYTMYLQPEETPTNTTEATQAVDTPAEVDEEITAIESSLDGLDDSALDETTLSDESLTE